MTSPASRARHRFSSAPTKSGVARNTACRTQKQRKARSLRSPHGAEDQVVEAGRRGADVAERGAAVERDEDPAPAPSHADGPRRRPPRIASRRTAIIRRAVPVPAPLTYVPGHVVQPVAVRRERADRTRVGRRRVIIARMVRVRRVRARVVRVRATVGVIVRVIVINRVSPRETLAALPAPRGPLPLGLGRQTVTAGCPIAVRCAVAALVRRAAQKSRTVWSACGKRYPARRRFRFRMSNSCRKAVPREIPLVTALQAQPQPASMPRHENTRKQPPFLLFLLARLPVFVSN